MTSAVNKLLGKTKLNKPSATQDSKSDPTSPTDKQSKGTVSDDGLVQWVKSEYDKCRNQRAQYQKTWELHLLHYGGEQWVNLITGGRIVTPNLPSYNQKLVTNLLRPLVRKQISRMTSARRTGSLGFTVRYSEDSAEIDSLCILDSDDRQWIL